MIVGEYSSLSLMDKIISTQNTSAVFIMKQDKLNAEWRDIYIMDVHYDRR